MSLAKRFKKSISIESMNDDLKRSIEELKNDLNEYNSNWAKIERKFYDPADIVYEECLELKRIVQLNKEELVLDLKKANDIEVDLNESQVDIDTLSKIDKLNSELEKMTHLINDYEKEAISKLKPCSDNKDLKKEFQKLKEISNYFISHSIDYLNESKLIDTSKLTSKRKKLDDYRLRVEEFYSKLKLFIFGNKLLELKKSEDISTDKLTYNIYIKQKFEFKRATFRSEELEAFNSCRKLEHASFGYKALNARCEITSNDKHLLVSYLYIPMIEEIYLYDFENKRIISRKSSQGDSFVYDFKIDESSIILISGDANAFNFYTLVKVLNFNLEEIAVRRVFTPNVMISHSKKPYICEMYPNGRLKVLDTSFNEILNATYQSTNDSEPFYLDQAYYKFEYANDKFYFLSLIIGLHTPNVLSIFDRNGQLIKKIDFHQDHVRFKLDSNGNIVIYNPNVGKILVYDQNGLAIKEVKIENFGKNSSLLKTMELLIDSKSRYILYCFEYAAFFVIDNTDNV